MHNKWHKDGASDELDNVVEHLAMNQLINQIFPSEDGRHQKANPNPNHTSWNIESKPTLRMQQKLLCWK